MVKNKAAGQAGAAKAFESRFMMFINRGVDPLDAAVACAEALNLEEAAVTSIINRNEKIKKLLYAYAVQVRSVTEQDQDERE